MSELIKLGAVVSLVMGQAPAASDCNKDGRGTPFVKVGEFGSERPVIREWTTDPKKIARESDVLICVVGATCGKINLGANCAIGRSVAAIRPNPSKIDQRYLWFFMQGKVLEMRSLSQGAAQTVITREMINELEIPLPPLAEQQRIGTILDEGLEAISVAVANAEQCRRAAKEMVDSEVCAIMDEAARRYPSVELGGIVDILDSRRRPITKSDRLAGPYPYYGATGIQDYVAGYLFEEPLVLLGEDGAKWGRGDRSAFAVSGRIWVNNHAHVLRPRRDWLADAWLIYALNSLDLAPYVTGVTVPKLNQAKMREVVLPIPPLARQVELIDRLDRVVAKAEELVCVYDRKLAALAELKQSVLARAFSGDLTREPLAA